MNPKWTYIAQTSVKIWSHLWHTVWLYMWLLQMKTIQYKEYIEGNSKTVEYLNNSLNTSFETGTPDHTVSRVS